MNVVTQTGEESIRRTYEAPTEIKLKKKNTKSIIKSVPLKATYTAKAALDTICLLFGQMRNNSDQMNHAFIDSKIEIINRYFKENERTYRDGVNNFASELAIQLGKQDFLSEEEIEKEAKLFLNGLSHFYPKRVEKFLSGKSRVYRDQ